MSATSRQVRALDILTRLHARGCPTYQDNSGSLSRDGCSICNFCDANLERREPHVVGCLWLEVESVVNDTKFKRATHFIPGSGFGALCGEAKITTIATTKAEKVTCVECLSKMEVPR